MRQVGFQRLGRFWIHGEEILSEIRGGRQGRESIRNSGSHWSSHPNQLTLERAKGKLQPPVPRSQGGILKDSSTNSWDLEALE